MNDYDWLALQIVRMGERFPDRVGLTGTMVDNTGNRCLIGEIGNAMVCGDKRTHFGCYYWPHTMDKRVNRLWSSMAGKPDGTSPAIDLMRRAYLLNDQHVPWGQIPKTLGLVPGELQGGNDEKDSRVSDSGEPVAADLVRSHPQAQLDDARAGQRGDVLGAGADADCPELVCTG